MTGIIIMMGTILIGGAVLNYFAWKQVGRNANDIYHRHVDRQQQQRQTVPVLHDPSHYTKGNK